MDRDAWEAEIRTEAALWNARIDLPDLDLGSYGTNTWSFAPQQVFQFGTLLTDGPPGVRVLSFQIANDELLVGGKVAIELFGPGHQRPTWIAKMQPAQVATFQLQNVAKAARLLRGVVLGNYVVT